jgi:DNA-binding phage protein
MARRSRDWNEGLAEDLRDPEFAREFLVAAVDEGVPLQLALRKAIRAVGVAPFARRAQTTTASVQRAIRQGQSPAQATLDWLLKPFRLRLTLIRLDGEDHLPASRGSPPGRGGGRQAGVSSEQP